MKKSLKYHLDVRVGYFLLLIIISACGVYYAVYHERIVKQTLLTANLMTVMTDSEIENSFHEIGNITVEISGLVLNPAVYTMNAGDTVAELLELAGGFLPEADIAAIDLNAKLFNMQEICIGDTSNPMISRYSQILLNLYYPPTEKEEELIAESRKININIADKEELARLPGIGPKLAESIVLYRETNGDFQTIEAMMEVPKIGEKKFSAMSEYITVNSEEP